MSQRKRKTKRGATRETKSDWIIGPPNRDEIVIGFGESRGKIKDSDELVKRIHDKIDVLFGRSKSAGGQIVGDSCNGLCSELDRCRGSYECSLGRCDPVVRESGCYVYMSCRIKPRKPRLLSG